MTLPALPKVLKIEDLVPVLAALEQRLTAVEAGLGDHQTAAARLKAENHELRSAVRRLRSTIKSLKRPR